MVWNGDLPQPQLTWSMCPECYMGEKDAIVFEPEGKQAHTVKRHALG